MEFNPLILLALGAVFWVLVRQTAKSSNRKLDQKLSSLPISLEEIWALCVKAEEDEGGHERYGTLASYVKHGAVQKRFIIFLKEHGLNDTEAIKAFGRIKKNIG